jgi:hypothetical protein
LCWKARRDDFTSEILEKNAVRTKIPNAIRGVQHVAAILAVAVPALLAAGDSKAGEERDDGCQFSDGPFSSDLVPPPTCTSPVGLCTHGTLAGDFPAIYDFEFLTIESAGDPTDPTEFVYTGHSTLTTAEGVIHTNDSGVIHLTSDGVGEPFVTTASIATGTERYVGATGVFVATGVLNMTTGHSVGSFIGQVCRARHDGSGDAGCSH